jgi:competence ComEA-like helix-hairpin-helix protein
MNMSSLNERFATLKARVMGSLADQLTLPKLAHRLAPVLALFLLFAAMGGTWRIASAAPPAIAATKLDVEPERPIKKSAKELSGKLNINTATEEQLMMLPTVGPAKAERIVTWRQKNGGFKRTADLRRVKGFGYKTFKRLEPFLDIKGDSTLK